MTTPDSLKEHSRRKESLKQTETVWSIGNLAWWSSRWPTSLIIAGNDWLSWCVTSCWLRDTSWQIRLESYTCWIILDRYILHLGCYVMYSECYICIECYILLCVWHLEGLHLAFVNFYLSCNTFLKIKTILCDSLGIWPYHSQYTLNWYINFYFCFFQSETFCSSFKHHSKIKDNRFHLLQYWV